MADSKSPLILLVEDDESTRIPISLFLQDEGFEVIEAESAEEGLELARSKHPNAIISDIKFKGISGIEMLRLIRKEGMEMPVILMTAYGTIEDAVKAMQLGAETYLTKPIRTEELAIILERALERASLKRELETLRLELAEHRKVGRLVGRSKVMENVFSLIRQVATSNATVLIYGESGTGKELVAEAIHQLSPRADGPFIKVNCAVFTENLLESELFGHEKGAFTGAVEQRKGRFELADGGSLFLDDIVVISHATQVKLLRFLQEREFERVGGNRTIKVDVRVIASTNEPLQDAVRDGRFRQDLFYRLNVIPITLPPLRERKEDIPLLVAHFIEKHAAELNRPEVRNVDPEVIRALMAYSWPGNVRELENWVQRAIVMCSGDTITTRQMPPIGDESLILQEQTASSGSGISLAGMKFKDIEREAIIQTLKLTGGSTSKAAKMLGISLRKLQYKVREYRQEGFDVPTKK